MSPRTPGRPLFCQCPASCPVSWPGTDLSEDPGAQRRACRETPAAHAPLWSPVGMATQQHHKDEGDTLGRAMFSTWCIKVGHRYLQLC